MIGTVVNIRMPNPHNAERYRDLWTAAYEGHVIIKVWGKYCVTIGHKKRIDQKRPDLVEGDLYRFLDLGEVKTWLNSLKGAAANKDDLRALSIPDHLKPDFSMIPYIFDTKNHRLYAMTTDGGEDSLSTGMLIKFLRKALNSQAVKRREFGTITVTPIQERSQLDQIWSMKKISYLDIEITPPNPGDDPSDSLKRAVEHLAEKKMEKQRISKTKIILTSGDPLGIKPDDDLKAAAEVAVEYGTVVAKGRVEGKRKSLTISTASKPVLVQEVYDPDKEPLRSVFGRLAAKLGL